jgi:signal transduction histidine kinase/ActR/RegA family two-component response regulator
LPALVVGASLTGLAVARALELRAAQNREQQQNALQLVTLAARTLDATVAQAQTLLTSLATSLDPEAPASQNDAVLLALFQNAPVPFSSIWIADTLGNNRGAAPLSGSNRAAFAAAQQTSFARALQRRTFSLGDVTRDAKDSAGQYTISFALPVIERGSTRITSVVGATLPIDSLDAVRAMAALPKGSVLSVMDTAGTIVLRTLDPETWVGRSFARNWRVKNTFVLGSGVGATQSADGTNRLTGYTRTERVPWMVFIGIPARYTLDVIRAQFLRELAVGGIITLIVLAFWYGLVVRLLTPIESLTEDASAIAVGDMARRSQVRSDDEVGDLARAFNSMADTIAERDAALRASQEQLLHAQKMEALGSFAGGIAHDFNNYLSAIVGHAELAALSLPEESEARGDIAEVLASSARAADLTKQILIFGRRQVVEPHVIDVSTVVRGIDKLLRRLLGEDRQLEIECTALPAPVLIDHGQLEQVIVNLVANARDATPQGGLIRVSTTVSHSDERPSTDGPDRPPTHVRLTVSDNGAGIPPAVRDRIFDPFFSTKARGQGTGLGLAIAYGIIRQSGGTIAVSSDLGVGTMFTVLLPLTHEAEPAADIAPMLERVGGRGRVLVAEDDDAVRNSTVRALEHAGYTVVAAADGPSALQLLRQHTTPFDLLLSDVVMPGMSGSVLAKRARALQPDMPVLFMSGYADDDAVRDGLAAGTVLCLAKPFTAAQLCAAVHRTMMERGGVVIAAR